MSFNRRNAIWKVLRNGNLTSIDRCSIPVLVTAYTKPHLSPFILSFSLSSLWSSTYFLLHSPSSTAVTGPRREANFSRRRFSIFIFWFSNTITITLGRRRAGFLLICGVCFSSLVHVPFFLYSLLYTSMGSKRGQDCPLLFDVCLSGLLTKNTASYFPWERGYFLSYLTSSTLEVIYLTWNDVYQSYES